MEDDKHLRLIQRALDEDSAIALLGLDDADLVGAHGTLATVRDQLRRVLRSLEPVERTDGVTRLRERVDHFMARILPLLHALDPCVSNLKARA